MAGDKLREEKRPHIRVIKEVIIVLGVSLVAAGIFVFQVINWLAKDSAIKDMHMLDSIQEAILAAMQDPEVINADDNSKEQIDYLMSPGSKLLSSVESGSKFYDTVVETMGWNVFSTVEQGGHMVSAPARDNGEIMIELTAGQADEHSLVLWIVHSDFDGWNRDYGAADVPSLTNEIMNTYQHRALNR